MGLKICMFVYNNCQHDSRVLKEAATLTKAGHQVRIVALLDKDSQVHEERDGFTILRVLKDPIHLRMLKHLKGAHPFGLLFRFFNFLMKLFSLLMLPIIMLTRCLRNFVGWIRDHFKTSLTRFTTKKANASTRSLFDLNWKEAVLRLFTLFDRIEQLIPSFLKKWRRQMICILIHSIERIKPWIPLFLKKPCKQIVKKLYCNLKKWWISAAKKRFDEVSITLSKAFFLIAKKVLMAYHRPFCFLDYYFRSFALIKANPADVYHAHDLNTLPLAYWLKKKTGGYLVYDSHEFYVERNRPFKASRIRKFFLRRFESFLVKHSDHVITVSDSIGKELQKRYSVKQLSIILNAPVPEETVDLPRTSNRLLHQALGIPEDEKIVLYVGNISLNRGLENLIQSLAFLNGCSLVMMGKAKQDYAELLKSVAVRAEVSQRIYFLEPVPQHQVINYAASADIGASPILNACLSYYYCLPNKLFECMNAGLPVIGSNFPEMKKIIEGYKIGKTFDPEDPENIAAAIRYIISDPQRYHRMQQYSQQASKIFNWNNEAKKLRIIYDDLSTDFVARKRNMVLADGTI